MVVVLGSSGMVDKIVSILSILGPCHDRRKGWYRSGSQAGGILVLVEVVEHSSWAQHGPKKIERKKKETMFSLPRCSSARIAVGSAAGHATIGGVVAKRHRGIAASVSSKKKIAAGVTKDTQE